MNLIFNTEATNRTNSITSRDLVIPACFGIKFMITYSKFHKGFSIRIFSSNIKINRWCIAVTFKRCMSLGISRGVEGLRKCLPWVRYGIRVLELHIVKININQSVVYGCEMSFSIPLEVGIILARGNGELTVT